MYRVPGTNLDALARAQRTAQRRVIRHHDLMSYDFLVDTYASERVKVLSVWSAFRDEDLPKRPHPSDGRGRSVREQMVHQCVSEDLWFRNMLGVDVGARPLPEPERRLVGREAGADELASQPGDVPQRLRILRTSFGAGRYVARVQGVSGRTYTVRLRMPFDIAGVEGGAVMSDRGGILEVAIPFQGAGSEWVSKDLSIALRSRR